VKSKKTADDAKALTISLTPEEEAALNMIALRRRKRREERDNRNSVVVDAVWHYLETVEKMPREQIENLFPKETEEETKSNVTTIRKKGDKIET
jgi:hypothetical protein